LTEKSVNQFDPPQSFLQKQLLEAGQERHVFIGTGMVQTISIYENLTDISQIWIKFQRHAVTTLYQTFQWCSTWQSTVGRSRGVIPQVIVARSASGEVVFILPLQIRKVFGIKILEWHGYPDVNYGYGLFSAAFLPKAHEWFCDNFSSVLDIPAAHDVLALRDMPELISGRVHPLQSAFNIKGANRSYAMDLKPDYGTLYSEKRSAQSRRSIRKRDMRLAACGKITFGLPATLTETHALIDEMFSQKTARLSELGVHGVFGPEEKAFVHGLADETIEGHPLLMQYALKCDGKILAVILGGYHDNTYWTLISSLTGGEARKHSPGDYVLRHMIEACCKSGFSRVDFAAGDYSYKSQWADEIIPLHATLRARNIKGLLCVAAGAALLTIKRLIKQTPFLRQSALQLRRALVGKKIGAAEEI
jgi:CelD/BcsL family acetyltransferase involved in cellulose biosynthesis